MLEQFREIDGEVYLTKAQVLAYVGFKSGKWVSEKWFYTRRRDGRLTEIPIDGKHYYKRSELDTLLRPQAVEQHAPAYSEQDFMTMKEFAEKVGLSYSSVSKLRRKGEITAINVSHNTGAGADYRIHRDEYKRWVEQRWLEEQQQQEKAGAASR